MTKAEDLTPHHLRCGFGSCPSVHRLDIKNDPWLLIVGDRATIAADNLKIPVDPMTEEPVLIPASLLATLREEWVREAVEAERERCAKIATAMSGGTYQDDAKQPSTPAEDQAAADAAREASIKERRDAIRERQGDNK